MSSADGNRNVPTPTKRRRIIVENDDEEMENELIENWTANQNSDEPEEVEHADEEIVEDPSDVDSNPDVYNGNMLSFSTNSTSP